MSYQVIILTEKDKTYIRYFKDSAWCTEEINLAPDSIIALLKHFGEINNYAELLKANSFVNK